MKTDVINKLNATEWIIIDNHVTTEVKNNEMYTSHSGRLS